MYDFIIIGARVAGAAAAMLLAQNGHKVLLVDRAEYPSDTLSTLMVQPRGVSYLYRWGLANYFKSITPVLKSSCVTREGISINSVPSLAALEEGLKRDHNWHTCINGDPIPLEWMMIRRKILDAKLIEEAIKAGAEFRNKYRVESIISENGKASGIQGIMPEGKKEIIKAKMIIIASGRSSSLMDHVGAKILQHHHQGEFCFYNFYEGLNLSDLKVPVHKRGRYAIAYGPTNENLHLISIWGPADTSAAFFENSRENFYKVIKFCYPELAERLEDCRTVEQYKGIRKFSNIIREAAGPGWLAIGDAAFSLTQTTAIGITNAFRDAELAAYYLNQAMSGEISFDTALKEYSLKHFADLEAYYHYACESAECRLPTEKEIAFLLAIQNDPLQAGRFIGVRTRISPVASFYNQENLESITSSIAFKEAQNSSFMKKFLSILPKYKAQQPWEWWEENEISTSEYAYTM